MNTVLRWAALACGLGVAACSGDPTSSNGTTPLLNADMATLVADDTGEDVDIMREPVFFVNLPLGGPLAGPGNGDLAPANCSYNPGSQRLECPSATRGELTITRSYAFWDAANASPSQYDAALTARANVQTTVSGERSGEHWSGSIERSRDMTATGLAGEETTRTWNGSGSSEISRSRHSDSGAERSYDVSCTLTVSNVVVPVPNGDERFPLSGTITRQCSITFEGGPRDGQTVERTATVTFNGTDTASVTVGDKTFDINLRTRHRGPPRP